MQLEASPSKHKMFLDDFASPSSSFVWFFFSCVQTNHQSDLLLDLRELELWNVRRRRNTSEDRRPREPEDPYFHVTFSFSGRPRRPEPHLPHGGIWGPKLGERRAGPGGRQPAAAARPATWETGRTGPLPSCGPPERARLHKAAVQAAAKCGFRRTPLPLYP